MLIIPGLPPLQQTRHSRELGKRVEQLVRDYQREHPDVTEGDVRAAFAQLTSSDPPSTDVLRRKRVLAGVVAALAVGAFTAMASTGGTLFENNKTLLPIIGVIAAVCGVAIAAFRISRR